MMVRCTVCNAVFEDSISVCPVCGKGVDFWVPAEAATNGYQKDTDESFVILGGGVAGISAAEAIRARNHTCKITIISSEADMPYIRTRLTKSFNDRVEDFFIHPCDWFTAQRIDILAGEFVAAMDATAKTVTLQNGKTLSYDKCIYALGASSFVPDIPGTNLPEVSVIRCADDIRRINTLLLQGKRKATIIGGGVLGLEAAWTLKQKGCDVVVIEQAPRIMARQLDTEGSEMLSAIAEREGIALLTGSSTQGIIADDEGHVAFVQLVGNIRIKTDIVVISIGVRANAAIAQAAGADVGRGVKVNAYMETNLSDVYACGDCAEFAGPNAQLWLVASEMGRVAGANAAGERIAYAPPSFAVILNAMNTSLHAEGDVGFDENTVYQITSSHDDNSATLDKRYYVGDELVGFILLGDTQKATMYSKALGR